MCRAIVLIFLTIVITSLCEKPNVHCGEHELDVANELEVFKGCIPINVQCFLVKKVFWFKGTFADCAGRYPLFANDRMFDCHLKNQTFGLELECVTVVQYTHKPRFLLTFIFFSSAFFFMLLIFNCVNRIGNYVAGNPELQDPNNRVCYCLSVDDVNNIVKDCATSREDRD